MRDRHPKKADQHARSRFVSWLTLVFCVVLYYYYYYYYLNSHIDYASQFRCVPSFGVTYLFTELGEKIQEDAHQLVHVIILSQTFLYIRSRYSGCNQSIVLS